MWLSDVHRTCVSVCIHSHRPQKGCFSIELNCIHVCTLLWPTSYSMTQNLRETAHSTVATVTLWASTTKVIYWPTGILWHCIDDVVVTSPYIHKGGWLAFHRPNTMCVNKVGVTMNCTKATLRSRVHSWQPSYHISTTSANKACGWNSTRGVEVQIWLERGIHRL